MKSCKLINTIWCHWTDLLHGVLFIWISDCYYCIIHYTWPYSCEDSMSLNNHGQFVLISKGQITEIGFDKWVHIWPLFEQHVICITFFYYYFSLLFIKVMHFLSVCLSSSHTSFLPFHTFHAWKYKLKRVIFRTLIKV